MRKPAQIIGGFVLGVFIGGMVSGNIAFAQVSSCTASVSPNSVSQSTSTEFTFTITNTSSSTIDWFKVTRPSSDFTITSYTVGGWSATGDSTEVIASDNTVGPSGNVTFYITATSGSSDAPTADWTVEVAEDGVGDVTTGCSGTLGTEITGEATPVVSGIEVTNVSGTGVTINWTTNVDSDSRVYYDVGTEGNYSLSNTNATLTTSHSITLSGLTANTTYEYYLESVNATGNGGQSGDSQFTTAIASPTPTPVVTATPTPTTAASSSSTATSTPTATPTPIPDTTAPVVNLIALKALYKDPPLITGTAADDKGVTQVEYSTNLGKSWINIKGLKNALTTLTEFSFTPELGHGVHEIRVRAKDAAGNVSKFATTSVVIDQQGPEIVLETDVGGSFPESPRIAGNAVDPAGESSVEYSLDGGGNWYFVDETNFDGSSKTQFTFTPLPLDDGNYNLVVRATDPLGNISRMPGVVLIIDRLPPQVSGMLLTREASVLQPGSDGSVMILADGRYRLTVSAIGGATEVSVLFITREKEEERARVSLVKNREIGVWSNDFSIAESGIMDVYAEALDGAGNRRSRKIGTVTVLTPGLVSSKEKPVVSAKITVYRYDPVLTRFTHWDGETFGISNPQFTDAAGRYYLWLPAGSYYLTVQASGHQTLVTDIFEVTDSLPVVSGLEPSQSRTLVLGPFQLALPDFRMQIAVIDPATAIGMQLGNATAGEIKEISLPDFSLSDTEGRWVTLGSLRGKASIVTIMPTWIPQAGEQVALLEHFASQNDVQIVVIVPHESGSQVKNFVRRGGYTIDFLADPDGVFINNFSYTALPTHIIMDRTGQVEQIVYGTMSSLDY